MQATYLTKDSYLDYIKNLPKLDITKQTKMGSRQDDLFQTVYTDSRYSHESMFDSIHCQ